MKVFHCDHCENVTFFENVRCLQCDHALAYLPDLNVVASLDPADGDLFTTPIERAKGRKYRLCQNYASHAVCNWAVAADDPNPLCISCRLTRVIPDQTLPIHDRAWFALETAKRRLIHALLTLGLPVRGKAEDPEHGVAFEFLADQPDKPVLTGHANGVIVVNVAEADDSKREARRVNLGEPYRPLLGHFRHEIGHYYWDRLVKDGRRLAAFRKVFGDERANYAEALKKNYAAGPPADWQRRHISSYASVHPWEDWAETWAHYLHMVALLETASDCGLSLRPRRANDPQANRIPDPVESGSSFNRLIANWYPLTFVLNNLNRSMGLPDAYPFVLSSPVVEKLRFVHETVSDAGK